MCPMLYYVIALLYIHFHELFIQHVRVNLIFYSVRFLYILS